MTYIPYEHLEISWHQDYSAFTLSLPWLTMDIDVDLADKEWVWQATQRLWTDSDDETVQRFIHDLKDYPFYYIKPRSLEEFEQQTTLPQFPLTIDLSTPQRLVETIGFTVEKALLQDIPTLWTWDREKIKSKSRIEYSEFYDPLSFISYLICYRLSWESQNWAGQDGLGQKLEQYLQEDEQKFFKAIGWISKQSWYVTTTSCDMMKPALETLPQAADLLQHYIIDEAGHYKFLEQVFEDINLDKDMFNVGAATKWMLALHGHMAKISPLAFCAMINLFEAAYYEGQDPISRVIKLSSKPHAARGYDLHYKINQEHRHCDMPLLLAQHLSPQNEQQIDLTIKIFELTLILLDNMEKRLDQHLEEA